MSFIHHAFSTRNCEVGKCYLQMHFEIKHIYVSARPYPLAILEAPKLQRTSYNRSKENKDTNDPEGRSPLTFERG